MGSIQKFNSSEELLSWLKSRPKVQICLLAQKLGVSSSSIINQYKKITKQKVTDKFQLTKKYIIKYYCKTKANIKEPKTKAIAPNTSKYKYEVIYGGMLRETKKQPPVKYTGMTN